MGSWKITDRKCRTIECKYLLLRFCDNRKAEDRIETG